MFNTKRGIFLISFLLIISLNSYAQNKREIRGTVQDGLGIALPGAYVELFSNRDTLSTSTGEDGNFVFYQVKSPDFTLAISHIGYKPQGSHYSFEENLRKIDLVPIIMKEYSTLLKEVTIEIVKPIIIKEDTIQYNADAFQVREGSLLEELMKKLPGVTVNKDGNISAQGKNISRVRVNGKDFFTGEVQAATRNFSADAIENVQVIDDYGEQAKQTGVKTGEPDKILNITLKEDRNKGLFGQALTGVGNNDRYLASGSFNFFEGDRQLSAFGILNNTNTNISTSGSIAGLGSDNFAPSGGDGIITIGSIGVNYRDSWSDKLTGYGSYTYSGQKSKIQVVTSQQSLFQDEIILNKQKNSAESNNSGHQFNYNLEYKPDQKNYLRFTPRLVYNRLGTESANEFVINREGEGYRTVTTGNTFNKSSGQSTDVGTNILFIHNFPKQGRSITVNGSLNHIGNKQEQQVRTTSSIILNDSSTMEDHINQQVINDNPTTNTSVQLSYAEPLGRVSLLQVNYTFNRSSTENSRETWNANPLNNEQIKIDSLSDQYRYRFTTQRIGFNYQLTKQKYNFTFGLFMQPVSLAGESVSKDSYVEKLYFNIVPDVRFFYRISDGKTLQLNYNVFANQPAFAQLQPVTDLSNPQYPVTGNPDLRPELNRMVNISYTQFNIRTNSTFFTNVAISQTRDKIVTNAISYPRGGIDENHNVIQETSYLNTNGFLRVNAIYNYSKPFAERKLTASVSGALNYSNNASFINYERISGETWGLNQGLTLRLDLPDVMDINLSNTYSLNKTNYSIENLIVNTTSSFIVSLAGRNFLFKKLTAGYNFTKTFYSGYSSNIQVSPAILDVYFEYNFLKNNKASIRLQGFDLFNQNVGVNRAVSGNSITDTRSNRLSRYFLLILSLRLQRM